MKRILAGFFLIGCGWNVMAQSSKCEETLNQATENFNAGHFYELPALLQPCLDRNDFTNEQRVRAYLLLTQAYLILDKPNDAEASYLKLLKADPEYVATEEKDPIDIVYLSKKFTSTPIFTPHVRIGLNTSFYRSINPNLPASGTLHRGLRPGIQFGGGIDWNINNRWSLCAEGLFGSKSYKLTISGVNGGKNPGNVSIDNVVAIEKYFGLDIPVYLKYAVDKGQIRPYGYAGLAGNFLFSVKDKLVFNNATGQTAQASTGPDVDFKYQRKLFSRSIVLGGGIKYKIGKDYVFADIRYMAGMNNLVKPNIYSNPTPGRDQLAPFVTQYEQVTGYHRLDNLAISFGYIRPLYDPRKIRKFSVRNIFHPGQLFHRKKK